MSVARPLKADLHAHSNSDPCDDIPYSSEGLIDEAARHGFDVLAITNHDCQDFCPRLHDYAKERGILLIRGMELTYERQHILLLNFEDPSGIESPDDIMRMKGPENLVVAPHPYFPWAPSCGRLLDSRPELFDAVEHSHLYNGWINFNRKAVRRAAEFGLPVVGTSDAHTLAQVGYNYTLVYSEKTPEVVIAAIKAGRCELATRPLPVTVFLWVILKMKYESAVRWLRRQATLFR